MELSDIRTEVRDRAGLDSADAMLTDAVLNRLINAALREVTNMRDWDWLVASETIETVVDQVAYDRSPLARISTLLVDEVFGTPLRLITPIHATKYHRYEGIPMVWFVEAGQLVIYPKPTAVRDLTHTFLATEVELALDDDEPLCPDYAIDLVVIKAAMKVTARTDNTSQHRLLADEERDVIESLVGGARRSKGSPIVESRRDWA